MEIIKPPEIAGKIMSLFDEADKSVVIVSPYNKFGRWEKMRRHLHNAILRGVRVDFYVRKGANTDLQQFSELGIAPIEIEDLHAKIYLNEKAAIITSMNMYEYSDVKSLEIGYQTSNMKEYQDVSDFISTYISRNFNRPEAIMRTEISKSVIDKSSSFEVAGDAKADMECIERLAMALGRSFPKAKITKARGYVFSGNLVKGYDLMIGEDFTIKAVLRTDEMKARFESIFDKVRLEYAKEHHWTIDIGERNSYIKCKDVAGAVMAKEPKLAIEIVSRLIEATQ